MYGSRKSTPFSVYPLQMTFYLEEENPQKVYVYNMYEFPVKYHIYNSSKNKFVVEYDNPYHVIFPRTCAKVPIRYVERSRKDCNVRNIFLVSISDMTTKEVIGKKYFSATISSRVSTQDTDKQDPKETEKEELEYHDCEDTEQNEITKETKEHENSDVTKNDDKEKPNENDDKETPNDCHFNNEEAAQAKEQIEDVCPETPKRENDARGEKSRFVFSKFRCLLALFLTFLLMLHLPLEDETEESLLPTYLYVRVASKMKIAYVLGVISVLLLKEILSYIENALRIVFK